MKDLARRNGGFVFSIRAGPRLPHQLQLGDKKTECPWIQRRAENEPEDRKLVMTFPTKQAGIRAIMNALPSITSEVLIRVGI